MSKRRPKRSALRKARALIEDPRRWTTGYLAKDKTGDPCNAKDRSAVCWCVFGACLKTNRDPDAVPRAVADAAWAFQSNPVDINDGPDGHRRVLELLDWAIAFDEVGLP